MDSFFTQNYCDRCGGSLEGGRTMSMYNTDCICMNCKDAERARSDYKVAAQAERSQVLAGNMNYAGIGMWED